MRFFIFIISFVLLTGCSSPIPSLKEVAQELIIQFNENKEFNEVIGSPITLGDVQFNREGETVVAKEIVLGNVASSNGQWVARLVLPLNGPNGRILVKINAVFSGDNWSIRQSDIIESGEYQGEFSALPISIPD